MDDADILIPNTDNALAQAELLLSGDIAFCQDEPSITRKGFEHAWDFLKSLPPPQRALLCLFFNYLQDIDKES